MRNINEIGKYNIRATWIRSVDDCSYDGTNRKREGWNNLEI